MERECSIGESGGGIDLKKVSVQIERRKKNCKQFKERISLEEREKLSTQLCALGVRQNFFSSFLKAF